MVKEISNSQIVLETKRSLADLIDSHTNIEGINDTIIPSLQFIRSSN